MFAAGVIEAVDVFEEGHFDLTPGLPVVAPDPFGLQRLEEAFDGRIVVAMQLPFPLIEGVSACLRRSFWSPCAQYWAASTGHRNTPILEV